MFAWLQDQTREAVISNPELFLPVFLLLTWKVTAIASGPRTLILALLLTGLLLVYAFRVLGKNAWLVRLGWDSPPRRFWLWSVFGGLAVCGAVWAIAQLSHESLGPFPRFNQLLLATTAGPLVEEILFRGLLFWALLEMLIRIHVPRRPAQIVAVLLIAFVFALAHIGRAGISFACTVLTGTAFGAMRICSQSTATTALMHGIYNFALSCMTLA